MPIDLTKRSETGTSPITLAQHENNLTLIENALNGLEASINAAAATANGLDINAITGVLPLTKGGTGTTTAALVRDALGAVYQGDGATAITGLWRGTLAQYNALSTKNATTLYVVT